MILSDIIIMCLSLLMMFFGVASFYLVNVQEREDEDEGI